MSGSITSSAPGAGGGPPSASPSPGAGTQPGQPPFGSSPVAAPTPNRGLEAKAIGMVRVAVRMLEVALPMAGSTSPLGKDVMKAITLLSKSAPAGGTSPGVENNAQQDMARSQQQQSPLLAALRARQQGGPTGSGAPPPDAGAGAGAGPAG